MKQTHDYLSNKIQMHSLLHFGQTDIIEPYCSRLNGLSKLSPQWGQWNSLHCPIKDSGDSCFSSSILSISFEPQIGHIYIYNWISQWDKWIEKFFLAWITNPIWHRNKIPFQIRNKHQYSNFSNSWRLFIIETNTWLFFN